MSTTAVFRFMQSTDSFLIQFNKPFPKLHKKLIVYLRQAHLANMLQQNHAGLFDGEVIMIGYESRLKENETNQTLVSTLQHFCKDYGIVWNNEFIPTVRNDVH
jgi:hypothetical protein